MRKRNRKANFFFFEKSVFMKKFNRKFSMKRLARNRMDFQKQLAQRSVTCSLIVLCMFIVHVVGKEIKEKNVKNSLNIEYRCGLF